MSILQFVGAALVMVGSALVLGAVLLADLEDQPAEPQQRVAEPAEWRKAA